MFTLKNEKSRKSILKNHTKENSSLRTKFKLNLTYSTTNKNYCNIKPKTTFIYIIKTVISTSRNS